MMINMEQICSGETSDRTQEEGRVDQEHHGLKLSASVLSLEPEMKINRAGRTAGVR